MSMSLMANLPRLVGRENYEDWAFSVRNFLEHEELLDCLDGTEQDAKKNVYARTKLCLTVDPCVYVHIKDAKTAKQVWDKLKTTYDSRGTTRKISLLRSIMSMRPENYNSMEDYVVDMIEKIQKLNTIGFNIDDELAGALILAGLPSRFEPMIMAIENSGVLLSVDLVKTKLVDERMEEYSKDVAGSASRALFSEGNHQQRARSKSGQRRQFKQNGGKKDIKCYNCHQLGHFSSKCPEKAKEKNGRSRNAFSVVFSSANFDKSEWYVDSGASVHLTCKKDWLINVKKPIIKEVMVANNHKLQVESSGDVEILTEAEGMHEIVIKNVQYVPGLTANLLSVSELVKKGNKVKFSGQECQIFNRVGECVAKAYLTNGVYKIVQTTQKCLQVSQNLDDACVWHRRLGHINSNAMEKMKNHLVEGIAYKEKQTGRHIKAIRSDNGTEYVNGRFEKYLEQEGIVHQKSVPYTPEQNGRSERLNRTLVERSRCLLYEANLEKKFWAEAVNTACYLRNRSAVTNLPKTPYEMFYGIKPNLKNVRVFGSVAMMHIPKERRQKWDKKSCELILVGFSETTKGYRLYNPMKDDVVTARDVHIIEKPNVSYYQECLIEEGQLADCEMEISSEDTTIIEEEMYEEEYQPEEDVQVPGEPIRRSERIKKPKTYDDYVTYLSVGESLDSVGDVGDPITFQEALEGPCSAQWKMAIKTELQSFADNSAWTIVDLPQGQNAVKCKWVFKRKISEDNVIFRARLVAKGFSQKQGIDFHETFSPVVRHSTLRLLISLSVQLNLQIIHLDVVTAFLNGKLEEEVYMEMPDGLDEAEGKVLKLNRAIYGLKQSSRVWYKEVALVLNDLGFATSKYEPCVFSKRDQDKLTVVALYVDDFFVFSNSEHETKFLKEQLCSRFKIKDLGELKNCLGMRVRRDESGITLDQESYVEQVLTKFNMSNCSSVSTPLVKGDCVGDKNVNVCDRDLPYQKLIGSLMYLSMLTRPDITFAVNYLSQFNNCYSEVHWRQAKRILRYLQGTKAVGLKYVKDTQLLQGFVDADYASSERDRKSYTGYVFKLAGAAVSWECKKQCTVALSSTEAEYMAVCEASKEAVFIKNFLSELLGEYPTIVLYNDNQSAQKLAENPMFHKRSKHIDVRYHYVREVTAKGDISLEYLPTGEMIADVLTKGLVSSKHKELALGLGLEI